MGGGNPPPQMLIAFLCCQCSLSCHFGDRFHRTTEKEHFSVNKKDVERAGKNCHVEMTRKALLFPVEEKEAGLCTVSPVVRLLGGISPYPAPHSASRKWIGFCATPDGGFFKLRSLSPEFLNVTNSTVVYPKVSGLSR
jgi:hypothetical protein